MDPINPWLDPNEVRRLAEGLMRPVRDPAVTVSESEAGFNEAFVGFVTPRSAVPAPQPAPPEVAAEVPVPPPSSLPVAETPPPPLQPVAETSEPESIPSSARGPFLERIQRFREWMHQHFNAAGIFILDREGSVIFDDNSHGRLHFLARSLALASRRQGSASGNVHVKIGVGATLEVIPVETAYGCLVLGAVVPDALPAASVTAVIEALSQVAAPPDAR